MPCARLAAFAVALTGLGASAAAAPDHALLCPHDGGAAWYATQTRHVRLAADVGPERLSTLAAELEEIYGDLVRVAPLALLGEKPVPAGIVDVAAFRDGAAVGELGRVGLLGYWRNDRIAVLDGHNEQLLRHELVHHVVARLFGDVPRWVNEGLAEYLATARVDDGAARVGDIPDRIHGLGGRGQTRFLGEHIPSLAELLAAPDDEFDRHFGLYYAGAWTLVHLVNNEHPEHRPRFRSYLRALSRGVAPDQAWRRAFAPVAATLQRQYDELLATLCQRGEFVTVTNRLTPLAAAPAADAPAPPRQLSDGDVHALWLERRSATLPLRLAEAQAAQAHDADSFDLRYATYELQRALDPAAAALTLRTLTEARPDDERLLRAHLEVELASRTKNASVNAAAARLQRHATDPASQGVLAFYWVVRRDLARAFTLAQRGLEQDRACTLCWVTLMTGYASRAQLADARAAFNHVLAMFDRRQPLPPSIEAARAQLARLGPAH
jgi:hypothetical protein